MKRRWQRADSDARVERLRTALKASARLLAQRHATRRLLEDRLRRARRHTELALRALAEAKDAVYTVQLAQIEAARTQSALMHATVTAAWCTRQRPATEDR